MRYECFIGLRYLLGRRKSFFVSLTTLLSMAGVAVGVMALIVVIAVMSGFDSDLKEKIAGTNAHLYIEAFEGMTSPEEVVAHLASVEEVTGSSPYIQGQGMVVKGDAVRGVLLRGVDPKRESSVTRIQSYLEKGSMALGPEEILLGRELANTLNVDIGDELRVVSSFKTKGETFRVGGIFRSGMYDYDLNLAFVSLRDARRLFHMEGLVGGVGARVVDMYQVEKVRQKVERLLGPRYRVTTWIDLNRNLFGALALEKTAMFIILSLIVCVACFNIASSLIMMVMEKTKDIGVLKSIGSTGRSIRLIFSIQGLLIGLVGILGGVAGGFGLCAFLKRYPFIRLPQDIYYIERLPVEIQWGDSFLIAFAALLISWLATLYPAWQASRLDPVEALRYE
ncbi:MAG: ABC transporter permease [Candidatus Omnitrophica bacterium]|nr:ABC transporter permease [Candidatus Omnitrophota bacterium]